MITQNIKQRSAEWHQLRTQYPISGSRIGALLGCDKYKSRADLMQELIDEQLYGPTSIEVNADMQRGIDHEDDAIAALLASRGWNPDQVERPGFVALDQLGDIGVSPDALVHAPDGVHAIEAKCPRKLPNEPSPAHVAQVRLVCQVCQADHCDLVYWVDGEIRHFEVAPWSIEEWSDVQFAVDTFLADMDRATSPQWERLAAEYRAAKTEADTAKARLQAATEALVDATGQRDMQGAGARVTWISRQGAVDYRALLSDNHIPASAADEYRKPPTVYAKVAVTDAD